MIAVVGSPAFQPAPGALVPIGGIEPLVAPGGGAGQVPRGLAVGTAVGIATAAAVAGATVQLVGKVGQDPAGEAVVLALARAGVGHAALLRTSAATPISGPASGGIEADDDSAIADLLAEEEAGARLTGRGVAATAEGGQPLDAADVSLGLRYLADATVVVAAGPVDEASARVIADAAAFVGGQVVAVTAARVPVPAAFSGATVLEAPADDPDGAFAAFVGRFAAGLDRGAPVADAFRAAADEGGWRSAE